MWKVIIISILILVTIAYSDILHVPSQFSTIQSAVNSSSSNDTILVQPGLYLETVHISHPLNLFGNYIYSFDTNEIINTIISLPLVNPLPDSSSLLHIMNADSAIIKGISFLNGRGFLTDRYLTHFPISRFGGAIICDSSNIQIQYCHFKNNSADWGGAIFLWKNTSLIKNCLFDSNQVVYIGGKGGAIYSYLGTSIVTEFSLFSNNLSNGFGGSVCVENTNSNLNRILNCTFINNQSEILGGAIISGSIDLIDHCSFVNNRSNNAGGVYFATFSDSINYQISNSIFYSNYGISGQFNPQSSALSLQCESDREILVLNNTFIENDSVSRGTVLQQSGSAIYRNNLFQSNQASLGSVLYMRQNANAIFDSNIVINNRSFSSFYLEVLCSLYVYNNDFIQNNGWLSYGTGNSRIWAENNYWGHPSGPWAVSNPNGQGDSIPTGVPYIPFRTTPVFPELDVRDFGDYGDGSGQYGSGLPNTITIEKVYPNPTNSTLTVHYSIIRPQLITFRLYDTNGREVYASLPQPQIAGSHTFSLQTDGIASGLYFLNLSSPTSPTESAMQKVVLLK